MYRGNKIKIALFNEFQYVLGSLHSAPMNKNEVVKLIKMCKNHLETSYSVVSDKLFKLIMEAKKL